MAAIVPQNICPKAKLEYDRDQRVKRGEFYTPDPVVSYIVRSVDYLLKTEFGLEDGLADTTVDPRTGEPLVQILDPTTGTGTSFASGSTTGWLSEGATGIGLGW